MLRSRVIIAGLLALVLAMLAAPAVGLAAGSAGDQQYTDPFGGGSQTQTSAPQTRTATAAPAPSTTPTSVASSGSSSGSSGSSGSGAATGTSDPTATLATTMGATTTSGSLPYTGYDAWAGAGFGATLLAGGLVLRLRARRS